MSVLSGNYGTPRKDSSPIDLIPWEISVNIPVNLDVLFAKAYTEVLAATFAEQPPWLDLAIYWATPDDADWLTADPLDLTLDLPLGGDEDSPAQWTFNIAPIVMDLADGHENPLTGLVENENGATICRRVSAALRALADQLDSKVKAT